MRIFITLFALIALATAAFADSGHITISPTSSTPTGSGKVYSVPSTTFGITISDQWTFATDTFYIGATIGSQTTPAGGTSPSVSLSPAIVGGSVYSPALTGTATNALTATSNQIITGDNNKTGPTQEIATSGMTLTFASTPVAGTYTGTVTWTLVLAYMQSGSGPYTATTGYSFTVSPTGTISVSPGAISSFTSAGGPQGPSWTFTAANNSVATSIETATSTAWNLKAQLTAHTGPETAVAMNLASVSSSLLNPTETAGATPTIWTTSAGSAVQVVGGTSSATAQSGASQIMTSGLVLTEPLTATPGSYTGTVTLTLNYGATLIATTTFTYSYTVATALNLSLDQGLNFSGFTPGVAVGPTASGPDPNTFITISTAGNVTYHLTAVVTALTFSSNTIPTTSQWLAFSTTSGLAAVSAAQTASGTSGGAPSITLASQSVGSHPVYLSEYLKTALTNPPGTYTGTITVTIVSG